MDGSLNILSKLLYKVNAILLKILSYFKSLCLLEVNTEVSKLKCCDVWHLIDSKKIMWKKK